MFNDALYAARRSTLRKFKTGCAIYDKKGRLLSIGWSHHPQMTRRNVTTPWSVHAEEHAISRLDPRVMDRVHRIEIATLSAKGNVTSGAPCKSCANRLSKLPFEEIIATQRSVNAC